MDTTTRVGRARIALDKPELVRSGMYAEADILVEAARCLYRRAGFSAVGSEGSETTVMTVKDVSLSTAPRSPPASAMAAGWRCSTGLAEGDVIVAKAGAFVTDGDKINPIQSATN